MAVVTHIESSQEAENVINEKETEYKNKNTA